MTEDQGTTPAQPPEDFHVYVDSRFGFSVAVPKRFEILATTMDPLARTMRELHDLSEEAEAERQREMPIGFWDPEVLGELEDGTGTPLRLFEFDAIRGRDDPLSDEAAERMWMDIQQFLPETLESGELPGYEFLEIRETMLGEMPALAFEYRWDGVRPGAFGGDHACVVWALGPMTVYHVYHHCAGEVWEARRPELDAILASFELLRQGEDDEGEAAEGTMPEDAGRDAG
jgi:hypothetical protein